MEFVEVNPGIWEAVVPQLGQRNKVATITSFPAEIKTVLVKIEPVDLPLGVLDQLVKGSHLINEQPECAYIINGHRFFNLT